MILWRRKLVGDPADRAVLRSAAISIAVRVAGLAFRYAAKFLLSRTLGVRALGEYVIALSWALALVLPAKARFDISALRYASLYFERRDYSALRRFIIFAFGIAAFLSLTIAAIVWDLCPMPVSAATRTWAAFLIPPLALLAFGRSFCSFDTPAGRPMGSLRRNERRRAGCDDLLVRGSDCSEANVRMRAACGRPFAACRRTAAARGWER